MILPVAYEQRVHTRNRLPLSPHPAPATATRFHRPFGGSPPPTTFPCYFHRRQRFTNAAPSIIELAELLPTVRVTKIEP
jgi:hypothetical protein